MIHTCGALMETNNRGEERCPECHRGVRLFRPTETKTKVYVLFESGSMLGVYASLEKATEAGQTCNPWSRHRHTYSVVEMEVQP